MDFVDLDEVVRTWAWGVFKAEKKDNKYGKDDLTIDINWKNTVIEADEPVYDETTNYNDGSQVLFKSYYTNRTSKEQEHTFRTERRLNSTCGVQLERGVTRECGLSLSIGLPDDVANATATFGRSVSVNAAESETIENEVTWSVDSLIRVRPRRKACVALVVTERSIARHFRVALRLRGFVFCVITSPKQERLRQLQGALSNVFSAAVKNGVKGIEVEGGRVRCNVAGSCLFRFGLEQQVEVKEEKLHEPTPQESDED